MDWSKAVAKVRLSELNTSGREPPGRWNCSRLQVRSHNVTPDPLRASKANVGPSGENPSPIVKSPAETSRTTRGGDAFAGRNENTTAAVPATTSNKLAATSLYLPRKGCTRFFIGQQSKG